LADEEHGQSAAVLGLGTDVGIVDAFSQREHPLAQVTGLIESTADQGVEPQSVEGRQELRAIADLGANLQRTFQRAFHIRRDVALADDERASKTDLEGDLHSSPFRSHLGKQADPLSEVGDGFSDCRPL